MSDLYKNLGKTIRHYRKSKNINTVEFASLINISTGQLSNIENGNYDVFRLEVLNKITDIIGVSLGELIQHNSIDIKTLTNHQKSYVSSDGHPANYPSEKVNHINEQLNSLIASYLATISEFEGDFNKTESITKHLINELHFIKNLIESNSKAPAS